MGPPRIARARKTRFFLTYYIIYGYKPSDFTEEYSRDIMAVTQDFNNKSKNWNFRPAAGQLKIATAGIAATAVYGLALTQIFNPLALAGFIAFGAGKTALSYYMMTRPDYDKKLVQSNHLSPLEPEHEYIQTMVDDIVKMTGMKPHTAYIIEDKLVRAAMPWYLRWMLKEPKIYKRVMENSAMALSTLDIVCISRQFIDKYSTGIERFAVAHEMGHAYNEDSSPLQTIAKVLKKSTEKGLLWGMGACLAFGTLGVIGLPLATTTLPVMAAGVGLFKGGLMLGAASFATNRILAYGSRVQEYRADRNAVYFTRNADADINFLTEASEKGVAPSRSPRFETAEHPSYHRRVAGLRAAFTEAAAHPVPPTVAPKAEIDEEAAKIAHRNRKRDLWTLA